MKKILILAFISNVALATDFFNPVKYDKGFGIGDDAYQISYRNEKKHVVANFSYHMKANTVCIINWAALDATGKIITSSKKNTFSSDFDYSDCIWEPIKPNHIAAKGLEYIKSHPKEVKFIGYSTEFLN